MAHSDDNTNAKELLVSGESVVIDVVEERVTVGKRLVETGRVEVAKTVTTEDVAVRVERLEHGVDVERLPVGKLFDELPAGTVELADGTVVYRVIREVPTVVVRYEVVEEIRVSPRRFAIDEDLTVPVRRERVDIRRTPAGERPQSVTK